MGVLGQVPGYTECIIELVHEGTTVSAETLSRLGVRCACHLLPATQQHSSVASTPCSWQLRTSRYGREKSTESSKKVTALLDTYGPRRFQLRKYVCVTHGFENGKHPVYDVKSEHFAANVIGRNGISVSHGAHFISNILSPVTPALMHWLMDEYANTANNLKINRNLFSLWRTTYTEQMKQWCQGLTKEQRAAAAALVVESSEFMHRCLPGGQQIGAMCRAIHDVVYKPVIPHLEDALAAINGGIVSFDGGHATSQSISVDKPAATRPLSMAEAAESQAGSAGARQPGVARKRTRTYIKVIILNVTGYNGAPIRCVHPTPVATARSSLRLASALKPPAPSVGPYTA